MILGGTEENSEPGMFKPKTLKRKNLKHLVLEAKSKEIPEISIDADHTVSPFLSHASIAQNLQAVQKAKNVLVMATPRPVLDISPTKLTQSQIRPSIHSSSSTSDISSVTSVTPTREVSQIEGLPDDTATLTTQIARLSLTPENGIQLENLVQLSKIGSGNSGTVVKTLHVPDSRIIAKKTIPVENKEALQNQLLRELTIMKNVGIHDNIVGFYGAFYNVTSANEIIILMEYMDCGSLDKILSVNKSNCIRNEIPISCDSSWFNEMAISRITYSVLNGLLYLYGRYKIIHRDIKPSNILISSRGTVKICDFGVSKTLINSLADTFVGTSTYMSPERIQGGRYTTKGDVWSLGLMIIELVTGEFPLGGNHDTPEGILDLLQRIVNEPAPRLPRNGNFTIEMVDFVNRCCIKEERGRSSLNELICHDFVCKYNDTDHIIKDFRRWCKKVKKRIKEDKMIRREETERSKIEKRQLERAAIAVAAARNNGSRR